MNDFPSIFFYCHIIIWASLVNDCWFCYHNFRSCILNQSMIVVIDALRVQILQVVYLRLFLTDLRLCIHVLVSSPLSTLCLRSSKHKSWLNLSRLNLCFGSFGRSNILRKHHWLIEYILIAFRFTEYYDRLRLILSFYCHKLLCILNSLLRWGCYNWFSVVVKAPGRIDLQSWNLWVGLDQGRRWCWLVTWLTYAIVAHW